MEHLGIYRERERNRVHRTDGRFQPSLYERAARQPPASSRWVAWHGHHWWPEPGWKDPFVWNHNQFQIHCEIEVCELTCIINIYIYNMFSKNRSTKPSKVYPEAAHFVFERPMKMAPCWSGLGFTELWGFSLSLNQTINKFILQSNMASWKIPSMEVSSWEIHQSMGFSSHVSLSTGTHLLAEHFIFGLMPSLELREYVVKFLNAGGKQPSNVATVIFISTIMADSSIGL